MDSGLDGLQGPFEMKVHVGHDGDRRLGQNRRQGVRITFFRDGDAHDITPAFGELSDLGYGGVYVISVSAGHGLYADGGVAADGDTTDHDLTGFSASKHCSCGSITLRNNEIVRMC